MNVFVRWRPLASSETTFSEISRKTTKTSQDGVRYAISIEGTISGEATSGSWSSGDNFANVFEPTDDNARVYNIIIKPTIPRILSGGSVSIFAYGHSGSGKTHSIVGYDFENYQHLGLCLATSMDLFASLQALNERNPTTPLGIGFSLFELRKSSAFDLLNGRTECHIREGPDGKTHFRGKTETLEGGKVRVHSIVQRVCWSYEEFRTNLIAALSCRTVGSSSIHDQSSRTHAVLELEIVNQRLVDARLDVVERQSELVPVGKHATDVYLEESRRSVRSRPGGGYEPNPDYTIDQDRINAAEAKKAEYEQHVALAEQRVDAILASSPYASLGAKCLFVDLAGAEYQTGDEKAANISRQTPQERQEARQINSDLLALKEVMRAWSGNYTRIPFRSSSLTMVLRAHFLQSSAIAPNVLVTVSPLRSQYKATLNSLKYANLISATSY